MPTYEYFCPGNNGHEFEEFHSMSTVIEHCPHCEAAGLGKFPLKKLINYEGPGIVELTGHDLKAKIKSDAQQLKRDASKNENLMADLVGHDKFNAIVK